MCRGLDDPAIARQLIVDWFDGFFGAISHLLPEKFCVFATSAFAYSIGLWIAQNPNRIESLFLGSPAGYDVGTRPDIYKRRIQTT